MKNYLNNSFLNNKKNVNQPIIKALLKYGLENFSLIILEYTDDNLIFDRETFWIINLKPYYNILEFGGSSKGYKHSDTVKLYLSELAKNRKHSEGTKVLIANALKGELNPFYGKSHKIESIDKIIVSKSLGKIYVYNSIKELQVIFPSITTLSKTINSSTNYIKKVMMVGIMFRGEWYFYNKLLSSLDTPKYISYTDCDNLIKEIKLNSNIKQAIFVFDLSGNFIKRFNGVMETEEKLNIRHEKIKQAASSKSHIGNYIFSYHRLLD